MILYNLLPLKVLNEVYNYMIAGSSEAVEQVKLYNSIMETTV